MPKQDGFSRYKCEHCDRTEYLTQDDKAAIKKFNTHRWINQDDVEYEHYICDRCESDYRKMRSEIDAIYNGFVFGNKDGDK